MASLLLYFFAHLLVRLVSTAEELPFFFSLSLCETCVVNVKCKDTFLDEHKSISADVDSMAEKRKGVVNAEIINDDELESDNSETLQHVDVNSNARELQQGPDNPAEFPKTVNHDEQVTNLLDRDRCQSKDFT